MKNKKKIISALTVLLLILNFFMGSVFAAGNDLDAAGGTNDSDVLNPGVVQKKDIKMAADVEKDSRKAWLMGEYRQIAKQRDIYRSMTNLFKSSLRRNILIAPTENTADVNVTVTLTDQFGNTVTDTSTKTTSEINTVSAASEPASTSTPTSIPTPEPVNSQPAGKKQISGNILLPGNQVAPEGGIEVFLNAFENDKDNYGYATVTIPEGQNSIPYSISVNPNEVGSGFRLSYYVHSDYGYVHHGYYSAAGTVPGSESATLLDMSTGDKSGINLTLIQGRYISGLVKLPAGEVAPAGGLEVGIGASNSSQKIYQSAHVKIPGGENSVQYKVCVPPNNSGEGYRVCYYLDEAYGYLYEGYYTPAGTVSRYSSASLVDLSNGDIDGINLTLLPGKIISGKVRLPEGRVAPAGGMYFNLEAYNPFDREYSYTFVSIPEGENFAEYSLCVSPNEAGKGYILEYRCEGKFGYAQTGYYNTAGTVPGESSATLLDMSTVNRNGIDIVLLQGKLLSGILKLPEGKTAPAKGLEVSVEAEDPDTEAFVSTYKIIPGGQNSVEYLLCVYPNAAGSGYKLRYYVYTEGEYVTRGYYSASGILPSEKNADSIDMSTGDKSGIIITLLQGKIIAGTISLPEGKAAPEGGADLLVQVENRNTDIYTSIYKTIPSGQSSVEYSVSVFPGAGYKVGYYMLSSIAYVQRGFYSTSGTTPKENTALLLDLSTENKNGINLTLLEGNTISGTVRLPEGQSAPAGGLEFSIQAYDSKTDIYAYDWMTIPGGESSIDYTLCVFPNNADSGYRVMGYFNENKGYVMHTYYNTTGTVPGSVSATVLDLSAEDRQGIDFTLIPGKTLSGVVKLPDGQKAPQGGVELSVNVGIPDVGNDTGTYVIIRSGQSSAQYSLCVYPAPGYLVHYYLWTEGYAQHGYYSATGTVTDFELAGKVDLSTEDKSGIDLTLVTDTTPEVMYGDVSGDGDVTAGDATLILRHIVGLINLNEIQLEAADVSDDGDVTAGDATLILRYIVGSITKFPAEV